MGSSEPSVLKAIGAHNQVCGYPCPKSQSLLGGDRFHALDGGVYGELDGDGSHLHFKLARFNLGKVQEIANEAEQVLPALSDVVKIAPLPWPGLAHFQQISESEHSG